MNCLILRACWLSGVLIVAGSGSFAAAQDDDPPDAPSRQITIEGNPKQRYFLVGPRPETDAPADGYALLIVLPGGDGGADFHPFLRNVYQHVLLEGFLMAQPIAPQWTANQPITWPTARGKVKGQKFTTEEFVDAVIADVGKRHQVDSKRIFLLGWSSGGPAVYAVALANPKIAGALVAMSVFKPEQLPPLAKAKGRSFYLYQSPEDRVTPFRMVERAQQDLAAKGARVKLQTYSGGHGWQEDPFEAISAGLKWLESRE